MRVSAIGEALSDEDTGAVTDNDAINVAKEERVSRIGENDARALGRADELSDALVETDRDGTSVIDDVADD